MAENDNPYNGLSPEEKVRMFLFDTAGSYTAIAGYSELLLIEAQKPEFQNCLPSEILEYLDHIMTAARYLAEHRQACLESMRPSA